MNTIDVLVAARKQIERPEDWAKGIHLAHDDGTVPTCAAIAITNAACGDNALRREACFALVAVIGKGGIGYWNDAPERTHAEVLAAFDRAIAAERAMVWA